MTLTKEDILRLKQVVAALYTVTQQLDPDNPVDESTLIERCDDYTRNVPWLTDGEAGVIASTCRDTIDRIVTPYDKLFERLCPRHLCTQVIDPKYVGKLMADTIANEPSLHDVNFTTEAIKLIERNSAGEIGSCFKMLKNALDMVQPNESGYRIITEDIIKNCRD